MTQWGPDDGPQYPPPGPYPAPYGYPPPYGYPSPYGYGYPPLPYPPVPTGPRRPGLTLAACVLGYINAGMLILSGAMLLFGASILSGLEDASGSQTNLDGELALDGFLNFVAAGLLIAGAVMFTGRRTGGRIVFAVGNGIVLAEAVYWVTRFNDAYNHYDDDDSFVVWAVIFAVLAILPLAFSFTTGINRWLRAEPAKP